MSSTESYKAVILIFSVGLGGLIAFGAFALLITMNNPSSRDVDDAKAIAAAITLPFPKCPPVNLDGCASLYWRPHPRRTEITIYGISNQRQQDEIIAMANKGRREVPRKPVILSFYEREVIEPAFGSGYQRGKEKLIREVALGN